MIEQTKLKLQLQNSSNRFIDPACRYCSFLCQLIEKVAEAVVTRHHAHINAGHDSHAHRIFFGWCGVMHADQFFDICPVRDDKTLKLQLAPEHVSE